MTSMSEAEQGEIDNFITQTFKSLPKNRSVALGCLTSIIAAAALEAGAPWEKIIAGLNASYENQKKKRQ